MQDKKKSKKDPKRDPKAPESVGKNQKKSKVTKIDADDLKKVKGGITPRRCCGGYAK